MVYYGGNDYRDYLTHYGVVGMHWGIRRYQPYSTTGPRKGGKTGKEIGLAGKVSGAVSNFRKKRAEAKAVRKQKKAAAAEEKAKKEKDRLLNEGSADEIMKNYGKLSNDELQYAINRLDKSKRLRELDDAEKAASIERGKKFIANAAEITKSAATIYTSISDIKDRIDKSKAAEKKREEEAKQKKANKEAEKIMARHDENEILKAMSEGKLNKDQGKTALEMLRNKKGIEEIRSSREKHEKEVAAEKLKREEASKAAEEERSRREKSQEILKRSDESRQAFKDSLNTSDESTSRSKPSDNWSESYRTALQEAASQTVKDLKMPGSAATKFVSDTISNYDSTTKMTERDKDRAYVLQRNESAGKKYLDDVFSKVSGSSTKQQDEQILRTWNSTSAKSSTIPSNTPKWQQRGESTNKLNYDQQYDFSYNYYRNELGMNKTESKKNAKIAAASLKKKK